MKIKRTEIITKLRQATTWRRILYERFTEPIHLNMLSIPVLLFGSYRMKIALDLVVRQQHAYALLRAADVARKMMLSSVTVVEIGVAAGAGLLNLCKISQKVSKVSGVQFKVVGFDSGTGMPPPLDCRDHPELYQRGDFPMDSDRLRRALPSNARLFLGPVSQTVLEFREELDEKSPLAFISIDVDYYSSTRAALKLLKDPDARKYLPATLVYLDDVLFEEHNSWCGELLAVREFNAEEAFRKIEKDHFLGSRRIMKRARWIDQIYMFHVLDHPARCAGSPVRATEILTNPYFN